MSSFISTRYREQTEREPDQASRRRRYPKKSPNESEPLSSENPEGDGRPIDDGYISPPEELPRCGPFPQYLGRQPRSSSSTSNPLDRYRTAPPRCHLHHTVIPSSKLTLHGLSWFLPGMANTQPPPPACGASVPFEACTPNNTQVSPNTNLGVRRNLNERVYITDSNGRSPSDELPLKNTSYIPVKHTYNLRSHRNEFTSFPPLHRESRSKGGLPRTCAICQSTSGCLEKGCHRGEGVDEEGEMDIDKSTSLKRQREVYEDGKRPPDMPPTKRAKRRTHPRQRNSGGVKGGGK